MKCFNKQITRFYVFLGKFVLFTVGLQFGNLNDLCFVI